MLAVPARIAGCPVRVMCTPPRPDGTADPAVLVAARLCGIDQVFKLGGAQADRGDGLSAPQRARRSARSSVPAMPGSRRAKQIVAQDADGAALDLPAGPSEVLVIADEAREPEFVAADLLAQAEHSTRRAGGAGHDFATAWPRPASPQCRSQLARAATRAIAEAAIAGEPRASSSPISTTAMEVANAYAPEHLILQMREPRALLPQVRNAGSVFLGAWTPETMGDYCSGTNHVLPTYGHARAYSGLCVADFISASPCRKLTPAGLATLGPDRAHAGPARRRSTRMRNAVHGAPRLRRAGRSHEAPSCDLARPDIRALSLTSRAHGTRRSSACTQTKCRGARPGRRHDRGSTATPTAAARAGGGARRALRLPPAQAARRARQRRGDRPAGAGVLPRRHGRSSLLPADLRLVQVAARIQGAGGARGPAAARDFRLDADALIAPDARRSWCSCARRTTRPATCSTRPTCCASAAN